MKARFVKKVALLLSLCVASAMVACAKTPPNKTDSSPAGESVENEGVSSSFEEQESGSESIATDDSTEETESIENAESSFEEIESADESVSNEEDRGGNEVEFPDVSVS